MGIVARVRRDGLSSAPLQSRPVSGGLLSHGLELHLSAGSAEDAVTVMPER
jgi:hypothetical protein